MKPLFKKIRSAARHIVRKQRGVSTLEFTLIIVLMAVAVLASLDSSSDTLELLLAHLAAGLAP